VLWRRLAAGKYSVKVVVFLSLTPRPLTQLAKLIFQHPKTLIENVSFLLPNPLEPSHKIWTLPDRITETNRLPRRPQKPATDSKPFSHKENRTYITSNHAWPSETVG
jgi:hypothetical protein